MNPECQEMLQMLKSRDILVPDDWIRECIQFVKDELTNENTPCSLNTLSDRVYDQWLLSDLRELKVAVLPKFVPSCNRAVIKGVYCVQVNSIVDISTSAYSQYQKMLKQEDNNTEIDTETEEQAKPWEPKPTRMLRLELTDGVITVSAIEDRPITALRPDLDPGTKVKLSGSIVCRKGVLFLGPENIAVLGGNDETLLRENSMRDLVKRKLDNIRRN